MKTVTLKRSDIVKVLEKEPLATGSWIQFPETPEEIENPNFYKHCKVCAVGAIVRGLLFDDHKTYPNSTKQSAINQISSRLAGRFFNVDYNDGEGLKQLLDDKDYMAALSLFFEHKFGHGGMLERSVDGTEERAALVDFVLSNFPETIEVTV